MFYISLVTYNSKLEDLNKIIESLTFVKKEFKLIVIDNSPTNKLKSFFKDFSFAQYIHNPSNPGFGHSHNLAMRMAINDKIKYHFVVNPDVYFNSDVMSDMISFMEGDSRIGMLMPAVLNEDGSNQNLPKLLPSPFSIVMRKLKYPKFIYKNFIEKYELRNVNKNLVYETPILSGCFSLFNVNALQEVGLYDERFYMYFEDWDLSRRINEKYKTLYYPKVSIFHGYESGANKSSRLFKIYLKSAVHYFSKWGWFLDGKRNKINKAVLEQFDEYR